MTSHKEPGRSVRGWKTSSAVYSADHVDLVGCELLMVVRSGLRLRLMPNQRILLLRRTSTPLLSHPPPWSRVRQQVEVMRLGMYNIMQEHYTNDHPSSRWSLST
jgi:hypothetical protein